MTRSNSLQMLSRTMEITDRLLAGASTAQLLAEYSQKWECNERTVNRFISLSKDKIFGELKNKEDIIDSLRTDTIFDFLSDSMLSTMELEARLCGIASGTAMLDKIVYSKGVGETKKCPPNATEQLRAITLLLKLRGRLSADGSDWKNRTNHGPIIMVQNEEQRKMIENT